MAAGAQLDKSPPSPGAQSGSQTGAMQPSGAIAGVGANLPGPLGKYWERGKEQWNQWPKAHRSRIAVGAALALAMLLGIFWYGGRTDWRTLYAGLDPEDSRQMAQVLTQAQIPFDLAANGTTIRVPLG